MDVLTSGQIGDLWLAAGGSAETQVTAVAVALAESAGQVDLVTDGRLLGLWQIDPITLDPALGLSFDDLLTGPGNAAAAVSLSAGGTNFAAWSTVWADPADPTNPPVVFDPQPDSAAYAATPAVAAVLTPDARVGTIGPLPDPRTRVKLSWHAFRGWIKDGAPAAWHSMNNSAALARKARR